MLVRLTDAESDIDAVRVVLMVWDADKLMDDDTDGETVDVRDGVMVPVVLMVGDADRLTDDDCEAKADGVVLMVCDVDDVRDAITVLVTLMVDDIQKA